MVSFRQEPPFVTIIGFFTGACPISPRQVKQPIRCSSILIEPSCNSFVEKNGIRNATITGHNPYTKKQSKWQHHHEIALSPMLPKLSNTKNANEALSCPQNFSPRAEVNEYYIIQKKQLLRNRIIAPIAFLKYGTKLF